MKTLELNATPRCEFGKKATAAIRKSGNVPCILYGGNKENKNFQIKDEDLHALLYTPEVFLVKLNIEGESHLAIVKDSQFHPVKDQVLHVDFLEVFEDKAVEVALPVHLKGLAAGVKAGGKLSLDIRKLRVKGLYKNLPESLDIDVTELGLGKTIQVGDLHFENLELMNAKNLVVCGVKSTRNAQAAATEEAAE